ncbi:MAG TPA: zinc ribbon domain-containing protein [Thermoanaerobaculaceae bacterium]|nr:zinc ribbon domain-containing protein [Thermoanaerobaculaceae bacterium]
MPLYEYSCRACGRRFEVLQRVGADAHDVACPGCGGREVAKQLSTFASAVAGSSTAGAMPCGAPSASACGSGGFS